MILVDTSVWIDFFNSRETKQVKTFQNALDDEKNIAFAGVILQELWQGVRSEQEAQTVEDYFLPFIEFHPERSSYRLAGKIYRDGKKQGFTIRKTIDCLIASLAIENNCQILHNDRDYEFIAKVSNLKIYNED